MDMHTLDALQRFWHMGPDTLAARQQIEDLWDKAFQDLQSLQTPLGVKASGQSGRFHAVFGRDSLWTVLFALEASHELQRKQADNKLSTRLSLPYGDWLHELAETVLLGLASLQGTTVNDVNEEQPGRIIHEYWEPVPAHMLASRWPVVNGRYYGSVDATPLFIATVKQVDDAFHDTALLDKLWPHVQAALQWMLNWSDLDQDGRVEYQRHNPEGIGLDNQVWKDSSEAVQVEVSDPPIQHPLAWIEVQGYAWAAYAAYIELAKQRNDLTPELEQELQRRMQRLIEGQQAFWLADQHYPAMLLDAKKQPLKVVSSNPGHLLWSGCVNEAQARQICSRLMQPDLLTPWGLRTLSEQAYYYNPLAYHCGTVWPFDNAVCVLGLQRYGFTQEAQIVVRAVLEAVYAFGEPVELYTVQPSHWIRSPRIEQEWFMANYFYASSVQAWTAAAILYFAAVLL